MESHYVSNGKPSRSGSITGRLFNIPNGRNNEMSTEVMIEKIRKASGLSDLTKLRMEHGFRQRVS